MAVAYEREPVVPSLEEQPSLKRLDDLLSKSARENKPPQARLVGPEGQTLLLPNSVAVLLARLVHALARGDAVTVMPIRAVLTTQQAADLLNVSRPFLVTLLESGKIPYHLVGTHRRVLFADLMNFIRQRDQERKDAVDELARASQDLGLYE